MDDRTDFSTNGHRDRTVTMDTETLVKFLFPPTVYECKHCVRLVIDKKICIVCESEGKA